MSNDIEPFSRLAEKRVSNLEVRVPLGSPLVVFIELTNRCNFACTFCPESFKDYSDQVGGFHSLNIEQFSRICKDIKALGKLKSLRFHMLGDALLNKDASAMIKIAVESGIAERVELTTNASALGGRKALELIESGLDYLRVSVYALDPEKHLVLTQSRVSPTQIARNVAALRTERDRRGNTKPFIYAKMIDHGDAEEISAFRAAWTDIADECCVEPSQNWNGYEERDLEKQVTNASSHTSTMPRRDHREVCPFPFYTLVIHSDGETSVCCVDWNKKTSVGNVFRESISSIWRGARLRSFQKMQIERRRCENESCRNCDFPAMSRDNLDSLKDSSIVDRLVAAP